MYRHTFLGACPRYHPRARALTHSQHALTHSQRALPETPHVQQQRQQSVPQAVQAQQPNTPQSKNTPPPSPRSPLPAPPPQLLLPTQPPPPPPDWNALPAAPRSAEELTAAAEEARRMGEITKETVHLTATSLKTVHSGHSQKVHPGQRTFEEEKKARTAGQMLEYQRQQEDMKERYERQKQEQENMEREKMKQEQERLGREKMAHDIDGRIRGGSHEVPSSEVQERAKSQEHSQRQGKGEQRKKKPWMFGRDEILKMVLAPPLPHPLLYHPRSTSLKYACLHTCNPPGTGGAKGGLTCAQCAEYSVACFSGWHLLFISRRWGSSLLK